MTKNEFDKVIEYAKKLDWDSPDDYEAVDREVYDPIYDAIKNNNLAVIGYLEKCTKEDRHMLSTAIEDGMRDGGMISEGELVSDYDRIGNLFRTICAENNLELDEILQGVVK